MYDVSEAHQGAATTALDPGERRPFRLNFTSTEFAEDFHAHSPLAATGAAEKAFFVYVSYVSANFDERNITHADRFLADRSPNHHVAFGLGIDRCLGSNPACCVLDVGLRVEGESNVVPQLAIARLVHHSVPTRGLVELTVRCAQRA